MVRPFFDRPSLGAAELLAAPASPEHLCGAGADVIRRARQLLPDHADVAEAPPLELRLLDGQLAVLAGLLRERLYASKGATADEVVFVSELLADLHTTRYAIHEHVGFSRLHRFDALERGLVRLWQVLDVEELLGLACSTAVEFGSFDRVLLSHVTDTSWRPWRSHARGVGGNVRRLNPWVSDWPDIRFGARLLESQVVRRREPVIVLDAESHPGVDRSFVEASHTTSYVVAPVVSGDRVIGLLHADHHAREAEELDRDVLAAFGLALGRIHERAELLSRLQTQRTLVAEAMRALSRNLDALPETTTGLGADPDGRAQQGEPSAAKVDRLSGLERRLTHRELEVLALMATGATNDRIAERLVIATETVKTHVKRVLRKLGAANRAEAISIYLQRSTTRDRSTEEGSNKV